MEADLELMVSQNFWDKYKVFMRENRPLCDLKSHITTPDDLIFYCTECDSKCDMQKTIKSIMFKKQSAFLGELFSELENLPSRTEKKIMMQKFMIVLLSNYAYVIGGELKADCKEIMLHFSNTIAKSKENGPVDEAFHELISSMTSNMNCMDSKSIMEPILFRITCIYACLAVSDRKGSSKCKELGKKITTNLWFKAIPEAITLWHLKKRNSQPVSELELLESVSF